MSALGGKADIALAGRAISLLSKLALVLVLSHLSCAKDAAPMAARWERYVKRYIEVSPERGLAI
jgi:hypothetical protein